MLPLRPERHLSSGAAPFDSASFARCTHPHIASHSALFLTQTILSLSLSLCVSVSLSYPLSCDRHCFTDPTTFERNHALRRCAVITTVSHGRRTSSVRQRIGIIIGGRPNGWGWRNGAAQPGHVRPELWRRSWRCERVAAERKLFRCGRRCFFLRKWLRQRCVYNGIGVLQWSTSTEWLINV